jgi:hypothetical protein
MEIYISYFSSVSSMLFQHGESGTEKGDKPKRVHEIMFLPELVVKS